MYFSKAVHASVQQTAVDSKDVVPQTSIASVRAILPVLPVLEAAGLVGERQERFIDTAWAEPLSFGESAIDMQQTGRVQR